MTAIDPATAQPPTPEEKIGPIMPRFPASRDRVLPIFIVASLIVHATAILPSLLRNDNKAVPAETEIPVEIVQLPPKPAEQPKPPPEQQKAVQQPKPPAPKPAAPKPQQESVSDRLERLIGMPAIALPENTPVGADEVSYEQLVLSKLAKAKKDGRYQHAPGATGVSFTLGDAGEVVKVEIIRSSGDKWLDDEAIAMVKRGAPYPPPPPNAQRDFAITLRLQSLI